ncbi:uncharacterized protein LOC133529740 [Cydia pomonella]|uniref:uncharacterized protein LOC133529740 n=1 Tax=Cydia pomonella TaxID=82600 RepID=UPI002ADE38F3|nr:uncharacterized protein LOC133529740 [Cydia pomonella]
MSKRVKQTWLDFLETYREARLLWDPQDEHRTCKDLRAEAYEKLLDKYKKIDESADLVDMKNRLANMRTAFNRERKKVIDSIQNGDAKVHKPTLWYFDIFNSFLDPDTEGMNFDTLKNFKHTMAVIGPSKSERECFRTVTHNESTNGKEDTDTPLAQKKRRIYNLLQKQERFVDTASQMLQHKEQEWEINGKAIGLQLYQLDAAQRTLAQQLISDTIFLGSMGKLTEESFVNFNIRQGSSEIHEKIEFLEEESDGNDDI